MARSRVLWLGAAVILFVLVLEWYDMLPFPAKEDFIRKCTRVRPGALIAGRPRSAQAVMRGEDLVGRDTKVYKMQEHGLKVEVTIISGPKVLLRQFTRDTTIAIHLCAPHLQTSSKGATICSAYADQPTVYHIANKDWRVKEEAVRV